MRPKEDMYKDADEFYDPDWAPPLVAAATAMVNRLRVGDPDLPPLDEMGIGSRDHYIIAAKHAVRGFYREAEKSQ